MDTLDTLKNVEKCKYFCEYCCFGCHNKFNFSKHNLTQKHIQRIPNDTKKMQKNAEKIHQCLCGKKYKYSQGLSKHKLQCHIQKNEDDSPDLKLLSVTEPSTNQIEKLTNLVFDVVKQNQELQKQVLELSKEKMVVTNSNNNNTTNNNKFNLNFFLNEQCKDAMNIMDFVKSLTLQLSDLETVGKIGYAEGISKVFVNGLKELDVFKRPIHCSDLKRETLYVKDEGIWEKENEENTKIKYAIKHIAHKNVQQISEWQQENPGYTDPESTVSEEYMKIINHSMGGFTEEEDETNYNKIIKNVAKEVVIQK
uniref:C2H2-type domain-containing protein n=1 Tax=viral metagenome TaxID=1070528 RepID=A0A6C0BAM9_9ZZZZ